MRAQGMFLDAGRQFQDESTPFYLISCDRLRYRLAWIARSVSRPQMAGHKNMFVEAADYHVTAVAIPPVDVPSSDLRSPWLIYLDHGAS